MTKGEEMILHKLVLKGRMPGLNEYIDAERGNKYKAASMKKEQTQLVAWECLKQLKGVKIEVPVHVEFVWAEPNTKRDTDNIAFAKKFILDGLVEAGVLKNDNQKYVRGFTDVFVLDRTNPHVEVTIQETWEC